MHVQPPGNLTLWRRMAYLISMPHKLTPHPKRAASAVNTDKARRTVYLPRDLDKALRHRCVELDRDLSSVVCEAIRKYLGIARPPIDD